MNLDERASSQNSAGKRAAGDGGRWSSTLRLSGTLLAIVLLGVLFWQQGWSEILTALRGLAPWRLLLAFVLMICSRLAISARWHVLLRSGGLDISPGQTLRVTFAGLFSNNFLPTTIGGDVIRLAGAARLGFDGAISAASLVADRLVGMAGMGLALPLGLPALALRARSGLPGDADRVALAGIHPLITRLWDKGRAMLQRLWAALQIWRSQPRALLLALGFTLLHQASVYSIVYLLFDGMGQELQFGLVAGLYSIVYFITLLPVSINGYGLQELSMTVVYARFAGASDASGLTVALLLRTATILVSVPGALFIPGLLPGAAHAKKSSPNDPGEGPGETPGEGPVKG